MNPIFNIGLQNRMSHMNEGLANLVVDHDRRVTSYSDYEEKQLMALTGN